VHVKRKRIVLIIDDEESVLQLFDAILSKEEYTALTANNGKDGLSLVESKRPDFRLRSCAGRRRFATGSPRAP